MEGISFAVLTEDPELLQQVQDNVQEAVLETSGEDVTKDDCEEVSVFEAEGPIAKLQDLRLIPRNC